MGVVVNISSEKFLPCYRHLLNKDEFFDIDFLYGGRDSGKSRNTAMELVVDCLRESYFKCLIIRKVLNTVRDSQYSLIKSVIEEWGLKSLFKCNDTRMEIICVNGNGFYGRGLDDVNKIKSFNNPSHCWIEEGNQITNDDFVVVLTSLRANQDVKTWFTFNPECDTNYTDFWLWQEWFSHTTALSWKWEKLIEVDHEAYIQYPDKVRLIDGVYYFPFKARATHTTYKDNPYCKPQRKALYESYKNSKNNAYWYQTYTLGLWGFKRTGSAFWKCFEEDKHTADLKLQPSTIHITLDNNVNPYITVSIWQVDAAGKKLFQIHEIPCEDPDNTAPKAARKAIKWLEQIGYKDTVFIYGDPSASAKSTVDANGSSFYDKFIGEIIMAKYSVVSKVQKSAPEVALSGSFINEIYESNHGGWSIVINKTCRKSIEDYTMAKEDAEGKILKKRETDPDTKVSFERYGHFSDAKRYFITTVLAREFALYKMRFKKRGGSVAGSRAAA